MKGDGIAAFKTYILICSKRVSRAAVVHLNFRAGSTFPVLVYTVPPDIGLIEQTLNRTSRCNKVDAVRLKVEFTFTKGSAVRGVTFFLNLIFYAEFLL